MKIELESAGYVQYEFVDLKAKKKMPCTSFRLMC